MKKKVLIVDDSALMRRMMSDIINEDKHLTVADTAKNGLDAIGFLREGRTYDVILLDLKMPKMDGIHFLKEMRKGMFDIPVLIVSSIAGADVQETIDALELGAFDFVKKPVDRIGDAYMDFRQSILARVYCVCGIDSTSGIARKPSLRGGSQVLEKTAEAARSLKSPRGLPARTGKPVRRDFSRQGSYPPGGRPGAEAVPAPPARDGSASNAAPVQGEVQPAQAVAPKEPSAGYMDDARSAASAAAKTASRILTGTPVRKGEKLVVIASSTGGPKALQSVVPYFPADFPYPVVVVQHMPAGFTMSLANRLNDLSKIKVKEAEDGETLEPGLVYIAQGGKQCELVQKGNGKYVFSENDKPARGGLRPCADIFFESLADTSFETIICGVLTGMGADASKGILQLKEKKAVTVVAQNQETCVVYGMPRAAKEAGIVDEMVPLEDVAGMMIKKIGV